MSIWKHVQGTYTDVANPGTFALTNTPQLGSIVIVGMSLVTLSSPGVISVSDFNGNIYTVLPLLLPVPGTGDTAAFAVLYSAPANAHKNMNVSWTGAGTSGGMWIDEFTLNGGSASFDTSASALASVSGTLCNQPTIKPNYADDLLYALCLPVNTVLTAPVAGANLGAWTGANIAPSSGNGAAYVLGASTPTPIAFTDTNGSDTYGSLVIALKSSLATSAVNYAVDDYGQSISLGSRR